MTSVATTDAHQGDTLKKQAVNTIAICLTSMFFLGIVAEFIVRSGLIQWHDSYQTYVNIRQSLTLFSLGIFCFIVIIILDVVLSACFYLLFSRAHPNLSLLMASLRLLYVAIKAAALVGLVMAKDIYSSVNERDALQFKATINQAMYFLKMHNSGFAIGLILFGLHVLLLALLVHKLDKSPRIISWLLFIAAAGYMVNSLSVLFFADVSFIRNLILGVFILPMSFSELSLAGWLFAKRRTIHSFR